MKLSEELGRCSESTAASRRQDDHPETSHVYDETLAGSY